MKKYSYESCLSTQIPQCTLKRNKNKNNIIAKAKTENSKRTLRKNRKRTKPYKPLTKKIKRMQLRGLQKKRKRKKILYKKQNTNRKSGQKHFRNGRRTRKRIL